MKATQQEQAAAIALQRAGFYNPADTLRIYQQAGSTADVASLHEAADEAAMAGSPRMRDMLARLPEATERAWRELEYNAAHGIRTLVYSDDDYPQRLRQCRDAPIALFCKGTASLNPQRALCIVGTRHATTYGQELARRFVDELKAMLPGTLIISGLAYGIDIAAHQAALDSGMETVAVLAHGLDQLYPYRHKAAADRMTRQGALVSEYTTETNADKLNFVRRNRIVAGMADACVVVESASKGGALITARIAADYHRDVMAFPGAVGAKYSEGCNALIRDNAATLITSARDFVEQAGWQADVEAASARRKGIERQMFAELSDEEQAITQLLSDRGDLPTNVISVATGIPIAKLAALLFSLEMKGTVRALAGGTYHLIRL